ncbi:MAG: polyphosphate polymerase domain-containing protein, partial [Alphaproteobacteria bacterium]
VSPVSRLARVVPIGMTVRRGKRQDLTGDPTLQTIEPREPASEIKFVVDPDLGERIREWARAHIEPDPHGSGPFGDEYRTASLYLDTDQHDVLHRRDSFGGAKYRIRRYADGGFVFVERKLRSTGVVVKRRTRTSFDLLPRLWQLEPEGEWSGDWFRRRVLIHDLRPACQVSYHRIARGVLVNGGRLTLDDSIRVAPVNEVRFDGDAGAPILDQQLVLELKFQGYLPPAFKRLIEQCRLSPQPISKYRIGMTTIRHLGARDQPPTLVAGDGHV